MTPGQRFHIAKALEAGLRGDVDAVRAYATSLLEASRAAHDAGMVKQIRLVLDPDPSKKVHAIGLDAEAS